jgi:hypothetical protein
VKEGDHVYVLGSNADTLSTVTAVDVEQIQVSMETDEGTCAGPSGPLKTPNRKFLRLRNNS